MACHSLANKLTASSIVPLYTGRSRGRVKRRSLARNRLSPVETSAGNQISSAESCGSQVISVHKGTPCRAPAVKGKRRCRMHGGAIGSSAPKGNQNALKHGVFTKAAILERAEMREFIKESEEFLKSLSETKTEG